MSWIINNEIKEIQITSKLSIFSSLNLETINKLVTDKRIATGISCLPTSWMYIKPFLPPIYPKLSSIEKNNNKIEPFLKNLFSDINT